MARDPARGDVTTLILAVLVDGPLHGYAIAREVERRSAEVFTLREGSLYPTLRGLEADNLIEGEWQEEAGPRARKTYRLTQTGQAELARRTREWGAYSRAMSAFLKAAI